MGEDYFGNVGDAETYERSKVYEPGRYHVLIEECDSYTSQSKGGRYFRVTGKVAKVAAANTTFVGDRVSHFIHDSWRGYKGLLKQFAMGSAKALGEKLGKNIDLDSGKAEKVNARYKKYLRKAFGESQVLAGVLVGVEARPYQNKDGEWRTAVDFKAPSKVNVEPMEGDEDRKRINAQNFGLASGEGPNQLPADDFEDDDDIPF